MKLLTFSTLIWTSSSNATAALLRPSSQLTVKSFVRFKRAMAAPGDPEVIKANLQAIRGRVEKAYENADKDRRAREPVRLVAVSKTKPKEDVIAAYAAGQRVFGENYVQELNEKSNDPEILDKCPEIRWHFIGNCQSKNAKKLAESKNLVMVETITGEKLAEKLQFQCGKLDKKIKIYIQVNTSGEENKNGVEPENVLSVLQNIREKCPNLEFSGLMTIGDLGHSMKIDLKPGEENPDFLKLIECRRKAAEFLKLEDPNSLELSMGMSNDFEDAIAAGSTNVRVGSSIFGARQYAPGKDPMSILEKKIEKL